MTTEHATMYQSARNCRTLCFQPILMIPDVLESLSRAPQLFPRCMLPKHIVNYQKSCSMLQLSVQINLAEIIQSNMADMSSNSLALIAVNYVFDLIDQNIVTLWQFTVKWSSFQVHSMNSNNEHKPLPHL